MKISNLLTTFCPSIGAQQGSILKAQNFQPTEAQKIEKNSVLKRQLLLAVITGVGLSGQAAASLIGFQNEINTGGKIAIRNTSSDGIQIQSVKYTLGDNLVFDTQQSLALSSGIGIAHWEDNDNTNVLRDASGSGAYYDVTSAWNTASASNTGYSGSLTTDVTNGSYQATFHFSDFNPNEAWGFDIDFDSRSGAENTHGAAMNNALVEVTFIDTITGLTQTLIHQYDSSYKGKKRSFPTDFSDGGSNVGVSATMATVPIPATAWLFGTGLLGMIKLNRSNKSA